MKRILGLVSLALALALSAHTVADVSAQTGTAETPDLVGVWDGSPRSRPINGPSMPWVPGENFPVLNERGLDVRP